MTDSGGHIESAPAEQAGEVSIPVAVKEEEVPTDAADLQILIFRSDLRLIAGSRMRGLRHRHGRRHRRRK